MQLPPLSVIASWPLPNYVNPVTRGQVNIVVIGFFLPLAIASVTLRIYTRLRISNNFGADDWLILATLVPTIGQTVVSVVAEVSLGWNRHIWDVPLNLIVPGLKIFLATAILFATSTTLTKCSMLALIYRIVGSGSGRVKALVPVVMIFCILQWLVFSLTVLFQCRPPSDYWKLTFEHQPNCINESTNLLVSGIVNILTDLIVVIIPIPVVMKLKLPFRQQLVVGLLFGAGFMITIVASVRTYYTYKATNTYDKTWDSFPVWICSSVELYVGIICACVPTTKKFFSRYIPKLIDSVTTPSTTSSWPLPVISSPSDSNFSADRNDHKSAEEMEIGLVQFLNKYRNPCAHEAGAIRIHSNRAVINKMPSLDTSLLSCHNPEDERMGTAVSSTTGGTCELYGLKGGDVNAEEEERFDRLIMRPQGTQRA